MGGKKSNGYRKLKVWGGRDHVPISGDMISHTARLPAGVKFQAIPYLTALPYRTGVGKVAWAQKTNATAESILPYPDREM